MCLLKLTVHQVLPFVLLDKLGVLLLEVKRVIDAPTVGKALLTHRLQCGQLVFGDLGDALLQRRAFGARGRGRVLRPEPSNTFTSLT